MKMDLGSRTKLALIYPDLGVRFSRVFHTYKELYGKQIRVTQGLRSWKEQAKLYAQGRTTPGDVITRAKPGSSFHNYGCAIDVAFRGKDPYLEEDPKFEWWWKKYGELAEKFGFVWGGHFDDRPHIKLSYGLTISELKELFKTGGLRAIWGEFDVIRNVPVGSEWHTFSAKIRGIDIEKISQYTGEHKKGDKDVRNKRNEGND